MNLSNGWCGPEGCEVLGTKDAGRGGFSLVVFSTMFLAAGATAAFYHVGINGKEVRAVYYVMVLGLVLLLLTLKSLDIYYPDTTSSPW